MDRTQNHSDPRGAIVAAPMSLTGSAQCLWRLVPLDLHPAIRISLLAVVLCLIAGAWGVIVVWYLMWGVLLVPYRLIRRGQRTRKVEARRHVDLIRTIEKSKS